MEFKKPWRFKSKEDKIVVESWPKPDRMEEDEPSSIFNGFREHEEEAETQQPFRPYFPPRPFEVERRWGSPYVRPAYGGRNDRFGYRRTPYRYEEEEEEEQTPVIFWQTAGALLLLLLVVVAFKTDHPFADRTKQVITASLQKDYMISSLGAWYREHVADKIALPVFNSSKSTTSNVTFVMPLPDAKAKNVFDARQRPVIELAGKANENVKASAQGIVEKVDKNNEYGQYVIINHGEQTGKTLYGHLGQVTVKQNEWVDAGQVIGQLEKKEEAGLLFGYMKDQQFVDPKQILDASSRGGSQ
ncbi:hypothetical protein DNHGIG_01470 [Collibacillus ludicampi]|uniref:M23ase beta-sheet core domain-containing protein n=1 Tax=Collibacillus ludicampi TaxID=2771369 RepID=A0AAV4LAB0_9BACL|nr:M23 family metallopeptidase [Collibacillus ludicampi]GIM44598.1 hypothetical protein DNHGIG_01470 [Collibacillus ludicampi]